FFRRGMARLNAAGISVYLISGNHDAASVITKQLSLPENVHVCPSKKPATVQPDAWPVAIHGTSFPNRGVGENLVPLYPAAGAGISVYLISGNHDAASVITKQLSLPENVHVFPSKKPATVQPDAWPVAIHGMSFPNRVVGENLVPLYPAAVSGKFNLGLLHTS